LVQDTLSSLPVLKQLYSKWPALLQHTQLAGEMRETPPVHQHHTPPHAGLPDPRLTNADLRSWVQMREPALVVPILLEN